MAEISESIVKGGVEQVNLTVKRSKRGVLFTVQIHPDIEELIKTQWSDGSVQNVKEFGSEWAAINPKPLEVYSLTKDPGDVVVGTYGFSLAHPGSSLLYNHPGYRGIEFVNLSILRIVGASRVACFEVAGAYSYGHLKALLAKVAEASKRFYIDYMIDVELTAKIITQETRL